jgi:hypothetical protein
MKRIIILLTIIVAFSDVFGQVTIDKDTFSITRKRGDEPIIDVISYFKNNGSDSAKINWTATVITNALGWSNPTVCDPVTCVDITTSFSQSFVIKPNLTGLYKITFDSKGKLGKSLVKLEYYVGNNSSNKKSVFYEAIVTESNVIISSVSSDLFFFSNNQFQLDSKFRNHQLQITDLSGKVVFNQTINNQNIDFKAPSHGIYFANILLNGSVVKTLKFDAAQ